MAPENKLPLLKQSMQLLVDQLGPQDQVGIVVYAGASGVVLEPTREKAQIREALSRLESWRLDEMAARESSSPTTWRRRPF
jgi:Ca-activated chloride channel family protein